MPKKSPQTTVDELRARIVELKAERQSLRGQTLGAADIEAAINRYLTTEAERYRQSALIETLANRGELAGLGEKDDAFFAFYFPDAIKTALLAAAGTDDGLPAADRRQRINAIDSEIFNAEVAEERAITEAESVNQFITRRADADPHTVLHEDLTDA